MNHPHDIDSSPASARTPACMICGCESVRTRFHKGGRAFVGCTACRFEWVDPMPDVDEIQAYYERTYSDGSYAPFAAAESIRALIARARLQAIGEPKPPSPWLEIGCSTGPFLDAARTAGIDIEGIEISPEAAARAVRNGHRVRCGRIEQFTPDRRFGLIAAFDVIEHLPVPRILAERAWEWLAPGGRLVLTLPNVRSVYPRFLMGRHWFYYAPNDHLVYFSPDAIARLLGDIGFEAVEVSRSYKPLTIAYSVAALETWNPWFGKLLGVLQRLLPKGVRNRPIPLYLGEMQVSAVKPSGATRGAK